MPFINRYTSKMLLAAIDEKNQGTYNFLYLPIDFKVKKKTHQYRFTDWLKWAVNESWWSCRTNAMLAMRSSTFSLQISSFHFTRSPISLYLLCFKVLLNSVKMSSMYVQAFNGKKWEKFNSEKVASLAYARIQGKCALISHFQNSSLMNEDMRCRPIIFDTPNSSESVQQVKPVFKTLFFGLKQLQSR